MTIGHFRHDAAAGGADDEALLDQVGFIDLLEGSLVLADRRRDRIGADRAALEGRDDGLQDLVIDEVEALRVDVEFVEGVLGNLEVDGAVPDDLGEIADALQEGIRDTRRSAAPQRYFPRRIVADRDIQDIGAALDDLDEFVGAVVLQRAVDAETLAERGCQQAAPGRRADPREGNQVDKDGTGAGALVYHNPPSRSTGTPRPPGRGGGFHR